MRKSKVNHEDNSLKITEEIYSQLKYTTGITQYVRSTESESYSSHSIRPLVLSD